MTKHAAITTCLLLQQMSQIQNSNKSIITSFAVPCVFQVHVIINALNPATKQIGEHHLLSAPEPRADKLSHVYTLVLHSNNRWVQEHLSYTSATAGYMLTAYSAYSTKTALLGT